MDQKNYVPTLLTVVADVSRLTHTRPIHVITARGILLCARATGLTVQSVFEVGTS